MVVIDEVDVQRCNDKLDHDVSGCTSGGTQSVNNFLACFAKIVVVSDKLFIIEEVRRDNE